MVKEKTEAALFDLIHSPNTNAERTPAKSELTPISEGKTAKPVNESFKSDFS